MMTKAQYVAAAAECGKAAFEKGQRAVPALDPAWCELLKANSGRPCKDTISALEAWHRAWASANLAAPVS